MLLVACVTTGAVVSTAGGAEAKNEKMTQAKTMMTPSKHTAA
jgi:hypothetical protein